MKPIILSCIIQTVLFYKGYSQGTWFQKADFGGAETSGAAQFVINHLGYVGTGSAVGEPWTEAFWQYDPSTNSWTQKADFGGGKRIHATGFSVGNRGYIGLGEADGGDQYLSDFWEYDPDSNTWTQIANYGGGNRIASASFTIAGKAYVGAGSNGSGSKKDFWEYDPVTNQWVKKANYGGGSTYGPVGFSIWNKGYMGTGTGLVDNEFTYKQDFWEYDPVINTWTQMADFTGDGRVGAIGFAIDSKGYIGTGTDGTVYLNDFWEYDPITNIWFQKSDFGGLPRRYASGFSIGGKGYIGLGVDQTDGFQDWWEFNPGCVMPTDLTATNITYTKATLNWNAVEGAVKYKVRYKVTGNNPWSSAYSSSASKTISGLIPNTQYTWQVKTVCSLQPISESEWSAKQTFTTSLKLSGEKEAAFNLSISPNPFSDLTTITFSLADETFTTLEIFDLTGRYKARQLIHEKLAAGKHEIEIEKAELSEGIYFIKLTTGTNSSIIKAIVQ